MVSTIGFKVSPTVTVRHGVEPGRETVVPMGRGKPGAKDRATGKRLKEREEDVDSPYR